MALQHGRGKQSFRNYTRNVKLLVKFINHAIKQGETLTEDDVQPQFTALLRDYIQLLQDEELDVELWQTRAELLNEKEYSKVVDKIQTAPPPEEEDGDEDEELPDDFGNCAGQFFSKGQILTQSEVSENKKKSSRRQNIFSTISEIEGYLEGIPPGLLLMIECTSRGFRIWMSHDTP